jgi:glycosyltransferase involved in cell wall biosynthesis
VKKLISILIPAKDAGPYLNTCIDSILNQSYPNWELIVINDSSSDNTWSILNHYQNHNEQIKVYENNGSGIIAALQTAYLHSNGSFIHRMDADDVMPVNKLELLMNSWEKGCLSTGMVQYFSDEWLVGLGFQNYEKWINNLMISENLWEDVYMECPIPSPAWLIERSDFERIGGFESSLLPEDYDFCFRAYANKIKINTVKEVIHLWRDSQNRTSRKVPIYFPIAYYPLKVYYFLKIDRDFSKKMVLWGAGKKGKKVAALLKQNSADFIWCTDSIKKIGVDIDGTVLKASSSINFLDKQLIIAVSSPEDKIDIQRRLDAQNLRKAVDYWWFC